MGEKNGFEDFIRRGLEDGVVLEPGRLASIEALAAAEAARRGSSGRFRFRLGAWGGPTLAAACLAVVCGVWGPSNLSCRRGAVPESAVVQAIGLLAANDGEEDGFSGSLSAADALLAWMDAPYKAALSASSPGD
ncbi:MAG: hypothetical protein IJI73_02440 [Kiritimatiellae bacterium]|nr:hypothetical protein [Kiritimatiellia bacterium]